MKRIIIKIGRYAFRFFLGLLTLLMGFLVYFYFAIQIAEPEIDTSTWIGKERMVLNDSTYFFGENFLRKNEVGIWEMYLKGSPEEIGYAHGMLAQELMAFQEEAFVTQIKHMIPDESYLKFLKYVSNYMNRKLPEYIPMQYQKEIKAVSLFADEKFNFIGSNYDRQLNYHAAHDIGHAMQNLNLVACTAFSVWDSLSADSSLLLGRNFDFYVGDDFAKNKVLLFVQPNSGFSYVSVAWAGMIGVVSGMNEKGLSITLNAAKSSIPFTAKTPVSIIAREIIQYASNIDEAYSIAKSRRSFVAETFFIGSAADRQSAIIEKTPDTTILVRNSKAASQILTNHFQSEALWNETLNNENRVNNATTQRFYRVQELINENRISDQTDFAKILRNPFGTGNENIGIGNELAINQYVAHHSIIIKPEQKTLWIATAPFQLGRYVPYHLGQVFSNPRSLFDELGFQQQSIVQDSIQIETMFSNFEVFKAAKFNIEQAISFNESVDNQLLEQFIESNPNFFNTWEIVGDYLITRSKKDEAKLHYQKALQLNIPNTYERKRISEKLENLGS
ncbi:MAG: choloylglycine hydrolase [Bacteroidales bacterium]|nr:choloylglycine hydrolase [Bacteroidales bacterium]